MTQSFKGSGDVVEFTAPAGGVVAGTAYLIGTLLVVARVTAAAGEKFTAHATGEHELPKAAGAWTEGAVLYWDTVAKNFTTVAGALKVAGCAAAAAAAPDATGRVRLNGVAVA